MSDDGIRTFADDDIEAFKQAFRRHAAGVAAVTALLPDGTPAGFTASSLASLAAVPPLLTFNMARVASAWPAIVPGAHVVVHMLGARNRELAQRLAGPHEERFSGGHWRPGPRGLPLLLGVPAWMLCRIVEVVPVAGNAVIVGQVEGGELGEADAALIYHERAYLTPGPPA